MTEFVRTADENFTDLPGFAFTPNYHLWQDLRMHYLDESERQSVMLLMHGMPTLVLSLSRCDSCAGRRRVSVYCAGPYGVRSIRQANGLHWYTIARHTEILTSLIVELNLQNITLVCQD